MGARVEQRAEDRHAASNHSTYCRRVKGIRHEFSVRVRAVIIAEARVVQCSIEAIRRHGHLLCPIFFEGNIS
jgi:hypothetical protein